MIEVFRSTCNSCGKSFLSLPDSSCPYCGSTDCSPATPENPSGLFAEASPEELERSALVLLQNPDSYSPALAIQQLAALVRCIDNYLSAAEELYRKTSSKGTAEHIKKFFLNTSSFTSDPIHERYFEEVEKTSASLRKSLEKTDSDTCRVLADAAIQLLLRNKAKPYLEGFLEADDGFAAQFVSLASDEVLNRQHEKNLSSYYSLLPNQKELDDRIVSVLEDRGFSPRKASFMEKFFMPLRKKN